MMTFDLKDVIASTRAYNFHSHTQFCDGRATMAQMASAAVAAGFRHYGFTPHSPVPVQSGCNMDAGRVGEYIREFRRLREAMAADINLYLSMEIDFLDTWGAFHPYFDTLPLDYRLSSVHFIPSLAEPGTEVDVDGRPARFMAKMAEHFDGDIRYVVDRFYDRTLLMIEKGHFDMIGHFDKIRANAMAFSPGIDREPWYRRRVEDVIEALSETDLIVEVNTKALLPNLDASPADVATHKPNLFPEPDIVRRLARAGVAMAVNSDAHFPERVAAGRNEAFRLIDEALGNK